MHILFATAEMEPIVATGGLGAASAGLVHALRRSGVQVTPVLPGYAPWPLDGERSVELDVPAWVGGAVARFGTLAGGAVVVVDSPSLRRPHPYVDPDTGTGWRDNDHRFFAWSAAVAAVVDLVDPDVVHVHDWHAATTLAHLDGSRPTVLSVHNLAHQGWCDPGWADVFGGRGERFRWKNSVNALAGGIALADRVVTVSPNYASEIRTEAGGMGLDALLASRGDDLVGILNGIDTADWDPSADPSIVAPFDASTAAAAKAADQAALCEEMGLDDGPGPLAIVVSRFDHQKGIDMLVEVGPLLAAVPVRLAVLGSGDRETEAAMARLADAHPGRLAFRPGYDVALAHRMFAAADAVLVPSRFEPCGLTQMQAMRYGAVPVVSDVGGLHDSVVDVDGSRQGTGIVLRAVSPAGIVDGVHRATRLLADRRRSERVRARMMAVDWSWDGPAGHYRDLYRSLFDSGGE